MADENVLRRSARRVWRFVADRPKLKWTLFALVGSLMGLYLIAALVVLNLDAEMVRDKLTQSMREQGIDITIGQLELSFPFSVTVGNIRMQNRAGGTVIELDNVRASIAVWRFMLLQPTFHFKASSGEGHFYLDIATSLFSADVTLNAEAQNFPIDRVALKIGGNPLPVAATLDGDARFIIYPMNPAALEGMADFRLNGLSVKPGGQWAGFLAGFKPKEARCMITAGKKLLATNECAISTNMGNMELRVKAALKDNIGGSPLEGAVVFAPQGSLVAAVETLYRKFRKADGKYYFPVGGTLATPELNL